jgi:hypothetical protein
MSTKNVLPSGLTARQVRTRLRIRQLAFSPIDLPNTPATPPAVKEKSIRYKDRPYLSKEVKIMTARECPFDQLGDTPAAVAAFWDQHVPTAPWWMEDREIFVVFMLNTRRRITGFHLGSMGILDQLLVHPREVYRPSLIAGAAAIVIAHNHPSGDPAPSEADIKVTRDLVRAGQLLKVELLDHLVMGKVSPERSQAWVSLRELGYFY